MALNLLIHCVASTKTTTARLDHHGMETKVEATDQAILEPPYNFTSREK